MSNTPPRFCDRCSRKLRAHNKKGLCILCSGKVCRVCGVYLPVGGKMISRCGKCQRLKRAERKKLCRDKARAVLSSLMGVADLSRRERVSLYRARATLGLPLRVCHD